MTNDAQNPKSESATPFMTHHASGTMQHASLLSRRDMLSQFGGGLAGIAFSWLLARDARASNPINFDLLPRTPHFTPRARNVIFLYMGGGPSQMDLFDPKPE